MLRPGDLCTHNKFECQVVSLPANGKVEIAYAVFLEDGEKIFDPHTNLVPVNRVKVVSRPAALFSTPPREKSEGEESLPSFSVRQERWLRLQSGNVENAFPDSQNSLVDLTDSPKKKPKRVSGSTKRSVQTKRVSSLFDGKSRKKRVSRTIETPSSSPSQKVVQKHRNKRVARVDDTPVPIVPDSFVDSQYSDSEGSSDYSSDGSTDSHSQMARLARNYEQREDRKCDLSRDEVEFAWDEQRRKVKSVARVSFIENSLDSQDSPDVSAPHIERIREQVVSMESPIDALKRVLEYVDKLHASMGQVVEVMRAVKWALEDVLSGPGISGANLAAELRMFVTAPGTIFKSLAGWVAAVQLTLLLTARFKRQLFSEFSTKVWEKVAGKAELCFWIASLGDPEIFLANRNSSRPLSELALLLAQHGRAPDETRRVIEAAASLLIEIPKEVGQVDILHAVSQILASFFPTPSNVTADSLQRGASDFAFRAIRFIAHNRTALLNCDKFGGFLPDPTAGQVRLAFGKHKGLSYQQVVGSDKGWCDWSANCQDPFTIDAIQWIDYVCLDRYWCVPGGRALRTDVDLIRMCKGFFQIDSWIQSKLASLRLSVEFYQSALPPPPHYLAYTLCVYLIFLHMLSPEEAEVSPLLQLVGPTVTRAEIVKEVIRPLLRLGEIVPDWNARIRNAIIFGRAKLHKQSPAEVALELRTIHAILMSDYVPTPTFSERKAAKRKSDEMDEVQVEESPVSKGKISIGQKTKEAPSRPQAAPLPDVIRQHRLPLTLKAGGDSLQVYLKSYARHEADVLVYDVEFDDGAVKRSVPRTALHIPPSTSYQVLRLQESQSPAKTPTREERRRRRKDGRGRQ